MDRLKLRAGITQARLRIRGSRPRSSSSPPPDRLSALVLCCVVWLFFRCAFDCALGSLAATFDSALFRRRLMTFIRESIAGYSHELMNYASCVSNRREFCSYPRISNVSGHGVRSGFRQGNLDLGENFWLSVSGELPNSRSGRGQDPFAGW